MTHFPDDFVDKGRQYTLTSWTAQNAWTPLPIARTEGVYFWDDQDNQWLDWASMLVNVNIGHGNQHVIESIQKQLSQLAYVRPTMLTESRVRLGELLAEVTPDSLQKSFFTVGGADANENAMKMARLFTGRQKIITRHRSYHGGTFGAMSAGGDPRRLANEPGVPWIVRVHDPYAYRSPLYRGRSQDEGEQVLVDLIAETIEYEGPQNIAAILLEGYSGTSGVIQGEVVFWRGIQALCDKYNILLIVDEVISGFGRTGKWFGIDHYPFVHPDMMVLAKGLTSGYLPLGAVVVSPEIGDYFDSNTLWGGLTYNSHPVSCAAAVATIEVYQQEGLIEHAAHMGQKLRAGLLALAERHPSIGEVRGTGLLQLLELVKNRDSREPMSPFNQPFTEPMQKIVAAFYAQHFYTLVRWNWIFNTPPLTINQEQLQAGLAVLDEVLTIADAYVE